MLYNHEPYSLVKLQYYNKPRTITEETKGNLITFIILNYDIMSTCFLFLEIKCSALCIARAIVNNNAYLF